MRAVMLGQMTRAQSTEGYVPTVLDRSARVATDRALMLRANRIGDNEAWHASQIGRSIAWMWAVESGELPEGTGKKWLTAQDERVCPVCGPMDGVVVDVRDRFTLPDEAQVWAPGIHPKCRCTMRLDLPIEMMDVRKAWEEQLHPRANNGEFAPKGKQVRERETFVIPDVTPDERVNPFSDSTNPFAESSVNPFGVTKNPFASLNPFTSNPFDTNPFAHGPRKVLMIVRHGKNDGGDPPGLDQIVLPVQSMLHYLNDSDLETFQSKRQDEGFAVGDRINFDVINKRYTEWGRYKGAPAFFDQDNPDCQIGAYPIGTGQYYHLTEALAEALGPESTRLDDPLHIRTAWDLSAANSSDAREILSNALSRFHDRLDDHFNIGGVTPEDLTDREIDIIFGEAGYPGGGSLGEDERKKVLTDALTAAHPDPEQDALAESWQNFHQTENQDQPLYNAFLEVENLLGTDISDLPVPQVFVIDNGEEWAGGWVDDGGVISPTIRGTYRVDYIRKRNYIRQHGNLSGQGGITPFLYYEEVHLTFEPHRHGGTQPIEYRP
jgi:hypothetical protein